MKAKEYRKLTKKELNDKIKELEFQMMKAQAKFGQAKLEKKKGKSVQGSDILRRLRRERARIKTILWENETKK